MLQMLAFGLVCMFGISNAAALGIGTYYNSGWGSGTIEYDFDNYYYDEDDDFDFDADYKTRAIGFVLDTNVAKDSVFNYRLNVSLDKMDIDDGPSIDGFVMDHTFGFGVLRNKYVRLWIGPQINLSYYQEDYDRGNYYDDDDDDFDKFGIGFGPAMGINIHAGDIISFTITSGYKFNFIFGSNYGEDYTGTEGQFYINFGMLFRINDAY